jgi:hypothetical protein
MASEQVTRAVPASPASTLQEWLARLGLSGKLLAGGGLVGLIAVFLPLLSVSIQMPTEASVLAGKSGAALPTVGMSQSFLVIRDWRGDLCLVGYLAALGLTYLLYAPSAPRQKFLGWAGAGVGGVVALLALWLLASAFSGSSSMSGFGASFRVSVGLGAILNLLAAAAVAAGGFLKAREEKLI